MNNKKQSVEGIRWQKVKNIFLYNPISELLILINLLRMFLYAPKGLFGDKFSFQFIIECEVMIPPIKVIGIDIDE